MIVTSESHTDHVNPAQLAWVVSAYAGCDGFFNESLDLPKSLGGLTCDLYGPIMGDDPVTDEDVVMLPRPGRDWASRLVLGLPSRRTRTITVIGGPDEYGNQCVLYTVYGGPQAPRELNDPSLPKSGPARREARDFWSEHALAMPVRPDQSSSMA